MKPDKAIAVVFLITCISGCSGKLDRTEYVRWVCDYENNLHVRKGYQDFVFDVQYSPADLVWLQRTRVVDQSHYQEEKKEIENMQYYTLNISISGDDVDIVDYGVSDMAERQRKLYYFSYLFQQDIKLEDGGEEVPCVLFHFERPVDLKNSRTFMLGFENRHKDSKEARVVITSPHFGSLPIKIKVSKDNIPTLVI
jgi:hypothetical protein